MGFYYTEEEIEQSKAYVLGYNSESPDEKNITIKVSPERGNNLYGFTVGDFEVVHYDPQFALTSYYTGNPILYPFPNRLRNCMYEYKGEHIWQMKHGIPIFLHSLVFDESWSCLKPIFEPDGVSLDTYIHIDENHPVYVGFPFKHTLHVIFKVTKKGFTIDYRVENEGNSDLPFGISYHTFFNKLDGDDGSFICVPTEYMMELSKDLLPTGKLLGVEGKEFDLRSPVAVGNLDLDNCFTGMIPDKRVFVDYPKSGLRIYIDSTDDFTHMQVFTPKGKPFFCVEKQTCSTDAPNLDAAGFANESHLLFVKPEQQYTGKVEFLYELS